MTVDKLVDTTTFIGVEQNVAEGENDYSRRVPDPQFGWTKSINTSGKNKYALNSAAVVETDTLSTTYDFVSSKVSDVAEWNQTGVASRFLDDKGVTVYQGAGTTVEYAAKTDLSGPTQGNGKVSSGMVWDPAAAAVGGAAAAIAVRSTDSTTDSFAQTKLQGTVTASGKSFGPSQFTVTTSRETAYTGDASNVTTDKVVGLRVVDGKQMYGDIVAASKLASRDKNSRKVKGVVSVSDWVGPQTNPANWKVVSVQDVDLTEKSGGLVELGSDSRTLRYGVEGVDREILFSDHRTRGSYSKSGHIQIDDKPSQTVTKATFTPNLAGWDAADGTVSETFNDKRVLNRTNAGDKLSSGSWATDSKNMMDHYVTVDAKTDLTVMWGNQQLRFGNDTKFLKTHYEAKRL